MTLYLSIKLLLIKLTFALGTEAALTARDVAQLVQDPTTSLHLKMALINALIGTARTYADMLISLAQRF